MLGVELIGARIEREGRLDGAEPMGDEQRNLAFAEMARRTFALPARRHSDRSLEFLHRSG